MRRTGFCFINLSFDGVLKTPSFGGGGGGVESTPPVLFVKTIDKVIRLCTVLIFFLSGSFEGIFHVFQLSFDGGGGVI